MKFDARRRTATDHLVGEPDASSPFGEPDVSPLDEPDASSFETQQAGAEPPPVLEIRAAAGAAAETAAPRPRRSGRRSDVFRRLFEFAPDGAALADMRGHILEPNPALCEMLGLTREQLIGKCPEDFTHPDDRASDDVHFRQLARGTVPVYSTERRLVHRSGRLVWASVQVVAVPDVTGRARSLAMHVHDISMARAQRLTKERNATLVEFSDDAIYMLLPSGVIVSWNQGAERLFGWREGEIIGHPIQRLVSEDRRGEFEWVVERLRAGNIVRSLETVRLSRDGRRINVSLTASPILDAAGQLEAISVVSRDITIQRQLQVQAQQLQTYLGAVLTHLDSGVLLSNSEGRVVYANEMLAQVAGAPLERLVGRERGEFFALYMGRADDPEAYLTETERYADHPEGVEIMTRGGGTRFYRWQQRELRLPEGQGHLDLFRDVTNDVKMRNHLERRATTDPLTGLYNRHGALQLLTREVAGARRHHHPLSVALIDVDHFKRVNDALGHDAGDRLLAGLADVLQQSLRTDDALARWGGEEFLAILPQITQAQAQGLAERLRIGIEQMKFQDLPAVTISVGVAEWDPNESSAEPSITRADGRMYEAKRGGGNRVA
jgi:diguanylate cyclase (GGDEF)-like protein/PAS domain S-box-containing protein